LKKAASGVLIASKGSTYLPVRLVLLAACGLSFEGIRTGLDDLFEQPLFLSSIGCLSKAPKITDF
jgi:small basic protein